MTRIVGTKLAALATGDLDDEPFIPAPLSAKIPDLTYVYNPRPQVQDIPKPKEGDPFYLPDDDGIYYQAGVFGPSVPNPDPFELTHIVYPVPRTWQSEGGDQA